ncbi:MAG: FkbM family methyltransferase [Alphaproteobacteria bacterium]
MTTPDLPPPPPNLTMEQYEALFPHATVPLPNGQRVIYFTPSKITLWRAQTLFRKEPDTIEWLSGFDSADVFVDIGANVGMYSILAACLRRCQVFAFEPEAQNFAVLNRNIIVNKLSGRVVAFPIALYDRTKVDRLFNNSSEAGNSHNSFSERVDMHLQPTTHRFEQGAVSISLDELIAQGAISSPNHVKIDVDGLEHKIVSGMAKTLRDPNLRSVLIELNTNVVEHRDIVGVMAEAGFHYYEEQVQKARRKEGPHVGIGNYIFKR